MLKVPLVTHQSVIEYGYLWSFSSVLQYQLNNTVHLSMHDV